MIKKSLFDHIIIKYELCSFLHLFTEITKVVLWITAKIFGAFRHRVDKLPRGGREAVLAENFVA
jgi:hypothetical protein